MPDYRRPQTTGGSWFFTVNLLDRRSRLLVTNIDALNEAVLKVQIHYPFQIDALVVLPNHLHAVWTLPTGDNDFSLRWRLIKTHFSKAIPNDEIQSSSRKKRGERGIWQRRFWEHLIRDDADYRRHIDYCFFNPVKHGYVTSVEDWPHSTFHRDVSSGLLPDNWAAEWDETTGLGERG